MNSEKTIKEIEFKINCELDDIKDEIEKRMFCNEEDFYRELKVYVFVRSIKTNLQEFFLYNKDNKKLIDNFIKTILDEDFKIEDIYAFLFENNGTKFDLFINKYEVFGNIEHFLQNR